MARSAPELFGIAGKSSDDRRRSTQATSSVTPTPFGEVNNMYDCVMSSQVGDSYAQAGHPHSSKSSLSSPAGSDDENWRMFPPEDAFVVGQCAAQPGESPHYSSRSSSLSGHLSVYGGMSKCVQMTCRFEGPLKAAGAMTISKFWYQMAVY